MKRILIASFAVLLLFVVGCGGSPATSAATATPASTIKTVAAPEHVRALTNSYNGIVSTSFPELSTAQEITIDKYYCYFKANNCEIRFHARPEPSDGYYKSFEVVFDMEKSQPIYKSLISVLLLAIGKNASSVVEVSQSVANAYSHDFVPTRVFDIQDYEVFSYTDNFDIGHLAFQYKNEEFRPLEKADYPAVDYETALSGEVNKGMQIRFTGTAGDYADLNSVASIVYMAVQVGKHEYCICYSFESMPIYFHKGSTYEFYGCIANATERFNAPLIRLEGFAKVE